MTKLSAEEIESLLQNAPSDDDVRLSFEALRQQILDGEWEDVPRQLGGRCLSSAQNFLKFLRLEHEDMTAEKLDRFDPASKLLSRIFWGTEYRDFLPTLNDRLMFVAMLNFSPFVSVLAREMKLGEFDGITSDRSYLYECDYGRGEDALISVYVGADGAFQFDLMPLFFHAGEVLELYIDDKFDKDTDAFVLKHIQDIELEYDSVAVERNIERYLEMHDD